MKFLRISCYQLNGVMKENSRKVNINPAMIVSIEHVFGATKIVTLGGDYYTHLAEHFLLELVENTLRENMFDLKLN